MLLFYSFLQYLFLRYKQGGVAGTFFIARPQNKGIQGCSRDFLYCGLLGAGNQGFVKSFLSLSSVRLFAPSAGGRRSLPGEVWRRGRASPWSLVTSPGRSRSPAGWVRASLGLRRLWDASRDVQHHRWTVCTWNVASCGGFRQGSSYIQVNIW